MAKNTVALNTEPSDDVDVLWRPQPKQQLALSCPADRIMYGGAAGGGKTDFLLMAFYQQQDRYGRYCHGIIFRRAYKELTKLIVRAGELFRPCGAVFKQKYMMETNVFIFPSGAVISFSFLKRDENVYTYQGQEYTFVGFDEIGNYATAFCWDYMLSRLRNTHGIPNQEIATCNPGGIGNAWILREFVEADRPNHIWWIEKTVDTPSGPMTSRLSYCFIPARLEDNQVLMQSDPMYLQSLLSLPDYLMKALYLGDWHVFAGQVFAEFKTSRHVVTPYILTAGMYYKFAALDWGYGKPFSLGWYAVDRSGKTVKYREWYGTEKDEHGNTEKGKENIGIRKDSMQLAREAWEISCTEGVDTIVPDPACFNKDDEHPSVAENFEKVGWKCIPGNHDRKNGIAQFHQMLTDEDENGVPMLTFFQGCRDTIRTLPMLLPGKDPEDIDTTMEDHAYDETRYAIMSEFVKYPGQYIDAQNRRSEGTKNVRRGREWNPYEENE